MIFKIEQVNDSSFRVYEEGYKIPLYFKTEQEAKDFIYNRKHTPKIDITKALFGKGGSPI